MSGIYGGIIKQNIDISRYDRIMNYWNQPYGREGSADWNADGVFLGCRLEHFTNEYPMPSDILRVGTEIWMVDAVLYNRKELIHLLNTSQKTVMTQLSDEELLVSLIRSKGYDILKSVNGDFAGAVYDIDGHTLTLFRDHMGVRPLFYYLDEKQFIFSTDIRGISSLPQIDISINKEWFYLNMMGGNDLSIDQTEYAYIRCVPPASVLTISDEKHGFTKTINTFWQLGEKKIRFKTEKEYQDQLRNLITDAIDRRLKAMPGLVGVELSGGLDSSVIAILINRLGRKGCYYSWSYSPDLVSLAAEDDERKVIEDICKQENITCFYSRRRKEEDYLTEHEIETWKAESEKPQPPYIDTTFISSGSRWFAHQGARIVFTGHGGDEGVSHRAHLQELAYYKEYPALMKALYRQRKEKNFPLLRTINAFRREVIGAKKTKKEPFMMWVNFEKYLNPQFCQQMKETRFPELSFSFDPISYIKTGGSRSRLDNVAYQGAACGVRYMIPFLDYRVIDYAVSIPRAMFNNGLEDRLIYRKTFADILPPSLTHITYKDMASMRNGRHMDELHKGQKTSNEERVYRFNKEIDRCVEMLDREYWKDYLNFEAFEDMKLKEEYTEDEYDRSRMERYFLYTCLSIQGMIKDTREWAEKNIP